MRSKKKLAGGFATPDKNLVIRSHLKDSSFISMETNTFNRVNIHNYSTTSSLIVNDVEKKLAGGFATPVQNLVMRSHLKDSFLSDPWKLLVQ